MKMGQRIYFWYKILLNMTIFWKKWQKITFLVEKKSWTAYRTQFWVKNAEIAW